LGALHEVQRHEFWVGGMCSLWSSIFQVISPFTVKYLISFADKAYYAEKYHQPAPHIANGIGLVLGITAMQVCQSTGTNQFIYRGMLVGGQCRAILINMIFEKAMKISNRAKAGGKSEKAEGEMEAEFVDALSSKSSKDGFVKRMLKKKFEPKGGPKKTPDRGQGISGDGTGWSNGKIVNLMSVDTYRVDQASGMFHLMWTSPVAVVITLVVLLVNLSYSALAGFGLLILGIPLLTKAIQTLFKRRRKINKITDQRVSLTQEILAAVRFVKFFGWESSFLERLGEIRKREIHAIQILLAIRNSITAVSMSMPVFASMLAFITYSLTNHVLDPAPIFSSLALFNSLRLPLNLLPLVIGQVTDASASIGRIQDFLLSEEQTEDAVWDENMEPAIEVDDASFTWERNATHDPDKPEAFKTKKQLKDAKEARKTEKKAEKKAKKDDSPPQTAVDDSASDSIEHEPFKIQGIDFTIGRNELVAVIGSVGSGKSSLLAALAGDMRKTSGKVRMGGTRALCAQYAWIQNATVMDNILFGKPLKTSLYNRVIDACALRPDLEMLPGGDRTEIGEKGITVSGGQKQRLNIARAIYFDADIILMDDPLSAVDAHVGRHIMDNAICGPLLKDKARVLCTHQLWVLNRCDRIIWMEDGGIKKIDTYDNLMRENEEFQKLMAMTAQEGKEEEKKEDGDEIETEKKDAKKARGAKKGGALMQQEERAVKSVSWGVYGAYIKASGTVYPGVINSLLVAFALVLSQCANIATSLWLSYWVSNKFGLSEGKYIGTYAALGVAQALLMYAFSTILSIAGTNASRTMLQRAMTRVLRAPMSFFDTTPLGRITNRFSKDIDVMDNTLTDAMRMYFITMAMIISVFALIITFFHYVSLPPSQDVPVLPTDPL
jgi:ATP-binding cassette, subfamily C (CFTR/MRP), member 1